MTRLSRTSSGGGAPVTSVSNSNGTLTVSPTTGAVVASLALGNANTWTALQTHNVGISVAGGQQIKAGATGVITLGGNPNIIFLGGLAFAVVTKTANYTAGLADHIVFADATAGAITITLPSASNSGVWLIVIKIDSSANAVTVSRGGGDTIEGATTVSLATQYKKTSLVSDGGTKWYSLSANLV